MWIKDILILILVLSVVFVRCDSQNKESSEKDLVSYVKNQIVDAEKWTRGDPYPGFVNNTEFKSYEHDLPIEDGGLVYVSILRKVNNVDLFLALLTNCDEKLDVLVRRTLELPYAPKCNVYFDFFSTQTRREIVALLYTEKYGREQLAKSIISWGEIPCEQETKSNIEGFKHKKEIYKASILLIASRNKAPGIERLPNQYPKELYDTLRLLVKEFFLNGQKSQMNKVPQFRELEGKLSQGSFEEPIFWQFEGPYIEFNSENMNEGYRKVIFDDFKETGKLPYFRYYENVYGFVTIVYIEKIF